MVKTKQTHGDYKMGFATSLGSLCWGCSINFITALLHMQCMFTISNLFLNKGAQHTELSFERHTKPLTICRAILTFIFSPLRRTFSRLTNSSASFRDSSCNKKTSTVNVLLHSEHSKICYESAPTWCEENGCSRPFDSTNSLLTMHS